MGKLVQQSDKKFYYEDMKQIQSSGSKHTTWQNRTSAKITEQAQQAVRPPCTIVRPPAPSVRVNFPLIFN